MEYTFLAMPLQTKSQATAGTFEPARAEPRLRRHRVFISTRPRIAAAIFVAVIAILTAIAWPITISHLQAIAVLDQVANKPLPAPLRWLITDPVTTKEVTLQLPGGPIRARLYTPLYHPNAPAIIVLHGVHYLGIDEPRLIAFASAMSSCGMRVLTPELPDIKDYHIGSNSIATIGGAAAWLSAQQHSRPVGVVGLSFSGSLSLLAAATPRFTPFIKFVVAIGSEDEMSRVAHYYVTGSDPRPNGPDELLPPHEYGALVLEYEDLQDFAPARDLPALRSVLRAHLYEDLPAERAALATLNRSQAAEAKQLMDTTSPITRRILAAAEARHLQGMAGVSPHGNIAHLITPVYLLHGEADNIIPSAETQWLEAELPANTLQASLISPVISHLDLDGKGPTATDQFRLVHLFALILHAGESR
jgi:pimeloyl-ACP methyl ester carboxylesterase